MTDTANDLERLLAPFRISSDELGLDSYACRQEVIRRIAEYIENLNQEAHGGGTINTDQR